MEKLIQDFKKYFYSFLSPFFFLFSSLAFNILLEIIPCTVLLYPLKFAQRRNDNDILFDFH